ncbi:MAG: SPOR domain-containing protein [Bdellovibrionaceae bacterium]|nr:SPOR domain-containing protein [Pseudobdellovibrionaceae bacterium]
MKKPEQVGKGKKENRLEKVIVFMLVVLISLLSFSVGVISGKGLSDKKYAMKSIDQTYSHALNENDFKDEGDGELSEEEIQQLANAALQAAEKNNGSEATTTETAAAPANASAEKESTVATNASKAEDKTPKASDTEEDRQPTSVKKPQMQKPNVSLDYTVQVASYPNLNDAESMSASLVKKGYPAFPLKVSIKGQDWYRVSVGSFKTKKEAMEYQQTLKKDGVVKDAVVQKLVK